MKSKCEFCKCDYISKYPRKRNRFCSLSCASKKNGFQKGDVHAKYWLDKKRPVETIEKIRLAKMGVSSPRKGRHYPETQEEKAYNWKGDNVSYRNLHRWVERRLGKPQKCERCGKDGLTGHAIHWANKSGKYLRKLTDWLRLCASCHKKYDSVVCIDN